MENEKELSVCDEGKGEELFWPSKKKDEIRVCTFNVHQWFGKSGVNYHQVLRLLRNLDVDIIGLQEVFYEKPAGNASSVESLAGEDSADKTKQKKEEFLMNGAFRGDYYLHEVQLLDLLAKE